MTKQIDNLTYLAEDMQTIKKWIEEDHKLNAYFIIGLETFSNHFVAYRGLGPKTADLIALLELMLMDLKNKALNEMTEQYVSLAEFNKSTCYDPKDLQ